MTAEEGIDPFKHLIVFGPLDGYRCHAVGGGNTGKRDIRAA